MLTQELELLLAIAHCHSTDSMAINDNRTLLQLKTFILSAIDIDANASSYPYTALIERSLAKGSFLD
jgi:hypothetical protein